MKKQLFILFFIPWLVGRAFAQTDSCSVKVDIDWSSFMQKQDLVWNVWPEYWYESAFMGNGMLGLMIYKEPQQNYIRFETGNCSVHDHRLGGGLFDNPRLLTGHFALHPEGEIVGGDMRLDLYNAETRAHIVTTRGTIALQAFVHAEDMVMVVRVTPTDGEKNFRWEWVPAQADSPRYLYAHGEGDWIKAPEDYVSNPLPEVKPGLSVQKLNAGGETAVAWREIQTTESHIYGMTVSHSYPEETAAEEALQTLDDALKKGFETLQEKHRCWWNRFYTASFLSLPDGVKENFYWIQMYKLASATRADRALIDNTGPWLTVTPWPNAWWNLNVQLTYWPLNSSNHLDLAASLENALYGHTDHLRENVPPAYRDNSLAIGRSSDLEGVSGTVGIPGGESNAEIGLLPWACHNLWLIYRHKMDDNLLRDQLFPLLKQAVNYYLHFVYRGEDGRLHLPATYSPEYGSAQDCNFDLALLQWGCRTLLDITDRLHIADDLVPRWKEVVTDLVAYPANPEEGLMIGHNAPYAFSHRHYSHLLAVYPLYLINRENQEDRELIEKSLRHWQSKPEALRGYSFTGASSIASALGNGNEALAYLEQLFDTYLSVNTLYRESGPVIETPLSAAQSIHDMLLQSWGGKIRIFPAVPDAWQDVTYKDFRTEGAFLVTACRKKGHTEFVCIKSLAGEPCVVVTDMENPVFEADRNLKVTKLSAAEYQIDLRMGEEVLIHPEGTVPDFTVRPIANGSGHCFGKKSK